MWMPLFCFGVAFWIETLEVVPIGPSSISLPSCKLLESSDPASIPPDLRSSFIWRVAYFLTGRFAEMGSSFLAKGFPESIFYGCWWTFMVFRMPSKKLLDRDLGVTLAEACLIYSLSTEPRFERFLGLPSLIRTIGCANFNFTLLWFLLFGVGNPDIGFFIENRLLLALSDLQSTWDTEMPGSANGVNSPLSESSLSLFISRMLPLCWLASY